MKYSDHVKPINGLKAYSSTDTIPPDPYDVSVRLAKHLLSLDRRLTWDLEDGCGSGSMMMR